MNDRLYNLLPAVHRMRDAEEGYPLRALLAVVSEQVDVVEDDLVQLWNNWFVETAEPWAVPYLGDLVGYRPVIETGAAGDVATEQGRALQRVLVPRREVANTIRYRRRKGTLALLEQLARDVADWPARPVEFFTLLGWAHNVNHPHPRRARTADLHDADVLDLVGSPFDRTAHTVDVRRVNSRRTAGRHNIGSVGVFVWRLGSYSVTRAPANCSESDGPHCFTFSVLGQDTPLFAAPRRRHDPTAVPDELSLPTPIRRRAFLSAPENWYGPSRSFAIWTDGWAGFDPDEPVPVDAIIPADLSDWRYTPPRRHIAVDPVLGRFSFPPNQLPRRGVRVTYHHGFPADIGGGEYDRPITDPAPRTGEDEPSLYRVGRGQAFSRIGDALARWRDDDPENAVVELTDSGVYVEPVRIDLRPGQALQLRAANRTRPVIRLIDWQTDLPDSMVIAMGAGARFTLDGLLVTGRAVRVTGPRTNHAESGEEPDSGPPPICSSRLVIRHCTLVPGWGIDRDCKPRRPAEPSLELANVRSTVRIEHSVVGSIQVSDRPRADPVPLVITDSVVDATGAAKEAVGAPGNGIAQVLLTVARSTVFGVVDVHAVELAENSIFTDCLNVARRQIGCVRYSYVPPGCRTPRRYHCQPDLVVQAVRDRGLDADAQAREIAVETLRVRPRFTDTRYGTPAYAQLATTGAREIKEGADDESEMGVHHDLFEPQRRTNLEARLDEFTPAGIDVGLLFAT